MGGNLNPEVVVTVDADGVLTTRRWRKPGHSPTASSADVWRVVVEHGGGKCKIPEADL